MAGNTLTRLQDARAQHAKHARRTSLELMLIENRTLVGWRIPPFQRPVRINEKVRQIAEEIRESGGVIPGVITVGVIGADPTKYIVDGQHRIEAFRMSDLPEGYADVRTIVFDTMADMAQEFVNLNSALVRIQPDDVLRGLEESCPPMRTVREKCPFVGYGQVRRGGTSGPVLSMSTALRVWAGAGMETPATSGASAAHLAESLTQEAADQLCEFLEVAGNAWGREPDSFRLWGSLNLLMCMWLYRRLVLDTKRIGNQRYVVLKRGQFRNCLMEVGANVDYSEWLKGRNVSERDRSPCYNRVKALFSRRLKQDGFEGTVKFPQPAWSVSR